MIRTSETSRGRHRLAKYCKGMGLDLGYGGDPIVPSAITLDLDWKDRGPPLLPYAPQNLVGDALNLYWFKDEVFDYVYSSHLLEDFHPHEQKEILEEWLRVLQVGGVLVLYLPDEKRYREHCQKMRRPRSQSHKNEDFSLRWLLREVISNIRNVQVINLLSFCDDYCFYLVLKKIENSEKSQA